MTSSTGGSESSLLGSLSRGFEQDRDDAFLVNEVALAVDHRTRNHSPQDIATGLLAVHENCRLTLPIFKQCLDTGNKELRQEIIHAIIRSIRDLFAVAPMFKEKLPDARIFAFGRNVWYPYNALNVQACWHHYSAAEKPSVDTSEDHYFNSAIWGVMNTLCDNADSSDLSLPETLSWAAGHPSVEAIRDIVQERGVTSRNDIESILESQKDVTISIRIGVL